MTACKHTHPELRTNVKETTVVKHHTHTIEAETTLFLSFFPPIPSAQGCHRAAPLLRFRDQPCALQTVYVGQVSGSVQHPFFLFFFFLGSIPASSHFVAFVWLCSFRAKRFAGDYEDVGEENQINHYRFDGKKDIFNR